MVLNRMPLDGGTVRCVLALFVALAPAKAAENSVRLPSWAPPEIHVWGWSEREFKPEGYRRFVDMIADRSSIGLLAATLRAPAREVVSEETHDQIRRAVAYAHSRGLRVAFDLDVRLARGEFLKRFPDQQQWMLRIRRLTLAGKPARVEITRAHLEDHMTWPGGAYEVLKGRLLRIYVGDSRGTLKETKERYRILEESKKRVAVEFAPTGEESDLIVVAAFQHRTPDVFAPALEQFQNQIYEQYANIPLDGVLKDEWGFPPVYNQGAKEGDFWYSESLAGEYSKLAGGDFIRDCVLMFSGLGGSYAQRIRAANHYMRLILTRNAALERSYYNNVKRLFGKDAFTGTHSTWGLMPTGDAFKNGYVWWWAPRDFGQTDEHWPLPVRTSLAKKMGKPIWYNMFYDRDLAPYYAEIWRNARAGGRLHFHGLWPSDWGEDAAFPLLSSPLVRAQSRIRLLNLVAQAPLDCPVAVVFGHAAALNWIGPHFGDLGVDFAEALWAAGYPADVIPSTEIESGALRIREDGWVAYGVQRYRALVFLNPEYEPDETFDFLRQAAASKTAVFIRGRRHLTFEGRPRADKENVVPGAGLDPTPARVTQFLANWNSARPSPADVSRLTDGTCVLARGDKNPAGDEIDESFYCGGVKVTTRAKGIFAIRLRRGGELDCLAASELRFVEAGKLRLELSPPVDVALWQDEAGVWHGAIQGLAQPPEVLLRLAKNWIQLGLPPDASGRP